MSCCGGRRSGGRIRREVPFHILVKEGSKAGVRLREEQAEVHPLEVEIGDQGLGVETRTEGCQGTIGGEVSVTHLRRENADDGGGVVSVLVEDGEKD